MALGVALVATCVPVIRAARTSTVRALADAARSPRRMPRLIAVSARLPVPLLLGLRVGARRPRRLVLSAAIVLIAVTGIVAALEYHVTLDHVSAVVGGTDPYSARQNQVLLVLTVMVGTLAAVNAIFVRGAALDARHASALARALGATLVVAVLTTVPARLGARRAAAETLQAELA